MPVHKREVPAVVLGGALNGLGVVRSLARAGVRVVVVDDDLTRPGMRTRYGRKHCVQALHGKNLIDELVQLSQSLDERPVLFVTQEATVKTIAQYRDQLQPWYRLTLGSADCVNKLLDKKTFHELAEQHGFRIPKSLNVTDHDTLAVARELRYPVIVKPAWRDIDYSQSFKKAYRIDSFSELTELCGRIFPVFNHLIVQEWIEGSDADIYFCLQYVGEGGEPEASFTGRKIRSWPPRTGGTASCVSAPDAAAVLSAQTTRFFKAVGFTGLGSMEYKRDTHDGEFYMVEPTVGRTDYQEEVATLNGVNIPLAAWCAEVALGSLVRSQVHSRRPVIWHNAAIDRRSAELQKQRYGRGKLDSGKKVDGWWRWYDPLPFLTQQWQRVGPAVRKRIKRIGTLARAKG